MDWRFWLIMMIGAWIAASIESIRFRKMKGYGSGGWVRIQVVLTVAQPRRK